MDTALPGVTTSQVFHYSENRLSTTELGTVAASDGAGTILAYRFANGTTTSPDGYFRIDATTGKLYLTTAGVAAASNDYETAPNQFTLSVQARDAAGNWSNATDVTLNVTDVNDHAPAGANDSVNTEEDAVLTGQVPVATDGDGDALSYAAASPPAHGTLTFNPDGSYVYTPAPDYSGLDSFDYTVSDGRGGLSTYTVTISVAPLPRFSINDVVVDEAAGTATFTVTRSGPSSGTSTVHYSTGSDTATGGSDFIGATGSLSFGPGETSKTITVTIRDDADPEGRETFTVTLSGAGKAKISHAQGQGTIVDDGSLPGGTDDRPLSVSSPIVTESSPYVVFKVDGAAGQQVTLSLTSGSGTVGTDTVGPLQYFDGKHWQDYTSGQRVDLPTDGSALLVRVALVNDGDFEGAETLRLSATNTGGSSYTGEATVADDGSSANRYEADNTTGTPSAGTPDDDRPRPPAVAPAPTAPAEQPPLWVEPVPAEPVRLAPGPTLLSSDPLVLERPATTTVGDALTSPSGFRVVVNPAPTDSLIVFRGVTDQFVEASAPIRIALPYDAFAHSRPDATILLTALQADGRKLPEWVQFDPRSGTFQISAPAGFKGVLQIKVIARDTEGREVSTMFRMHVGQERDLKPQSRHGLSEQLRLAAQRWTGGAERGQSAPDRLAQGPNPTRLARPGA